MNIVSFEQIIKVAEEGSISSAADKLFISQSNLSRKIQQVEEEMNIDIFYRTNQGVEVTTEGSKFINYGRNILELYHAMLNIGQEEILKEDVFYLSSIRSSLVVEAFISLVNKYTDKECLKFKLEETDYLGPINNVYYKKSNLGIIFIEEKMRNEINHQLKVKNIEYVKICDLDVSVITRENHPINKIENIKKEDLYKYGLVIYDIYNEMNSSSKVLDYYDSMLKFSNYRKIVFVKERGTLHNILKNTDYIALGITNYLKMDNIYNLRTITVKDIIFQPKIEMGIVYNKEVRVNEYSRNFINILMNMYK